MANVTQFSVLQKDILVLCCFFEQIKGIYIIEHTAVCCHPVVLMLEPLIYVHQHLGQLLDSGIQHLSTSWIVNQF